MTEDEVEPVELPIDGILDLHTFLPREVPDLVKTWLDECRARGIRELRIIHGKGRGNLRRTVHAILERRAAAPCVQCRRLRRRPASPAALARTDDPATQVDRADVRRRRPPCG